MHRGLGRRRARCNSALLDSLIRTGRLLIRHTTTAEISVSPGDRRKSPASRPGRAGYSDPNQKVNKYFVLHPMATFPFATPAFPWEDTFGNK